MWCCETRDHDKAKDRDGGLPSAASDDADRRSFVGAQMPCRSVVPSLFIRTSQLGVVGNNNNTATRALQPSALDLAHTHTTAPLHKTNRTSSPNATSPRAPHVESCVCPRDRSSSPYPSSTRPKQRQPETGRARPLSSLEGRERERGERQTPSSSSSNGSVSGNNHDARRPGGRGLR